MDKNRNIYIIVYAALLTIVVAAVLAFVTERLKEKQEYNQLIAKKTDILAAISKDKEIDLEGFFDENIRGIVLNNKGEILEENVMNIDVVKEKRKQDKERKLALFIYDSPEGSKFIIPLSGKGLWDAIWGYAALNDDFETIFGVSFDHKAETPGLGAEIKDNDAYKHSFIGKNLYRKGAFVSVEMKKGPIRYEENQVAGVTGATETSKGVTKMMFQDIAMYLPYFEKLKKSR